jgi:hypothetical protein
MTDLLAFIRRNPVECAVIAAIVLIAWAGGFWAVACGVTGC